MFMPCHQNAGQNHSLMTADKSFEYVANLEFLGTIVTDHNCILYGCKTWSITLREEHRLGVFGNRALKGIFRPKKRKWQEAGEDCIMRSFITCTLHQILLRCSSQGGCDWL